MAADLRVTMDRILREYGYNILLIKGLEARKNMPEGKTPFQKHTVRSTLPGSVSLTGVAQELEAGIARDVDMIYYFRYTSNPHEGDMIVDDYDRDAHDGQQFVIDWAVPMRGKGGRIEFFTCGATRARNQPYND